MLSTVIPRKEGWTKRETNPWFALKNLSERVLSKLIEENCSPEAEV